MSQKIQIRRGLKAALPTLDVGEFGFTTDTEELYVGSAIGNVQIAKKSDIQSKTSITDSTTNGYIVVDGVQLQVYDDSALTKALAGKVDVGTKYFLKDLVDVDLTNNANGYILLYDSVTGKFTSQPLPASGGGGGSTVVDSSINGNVIVDGSEMQVYDDSIVKGEIGTLSNLQTTVQSDLVSAVNEVKSDIPTSLSGLSDVDLANKTNGYGMLYNSTTGKVTLSPLPAGGGGGATSMSGLSDVDVITNAPTDGEVLTYSVANGKWMPESPTSSPTSVNAYEIELSRWGITQGLPAKPYTTANYTTANNNITGINNALSWAHTNGYDYVVFPRGQYSICYNSSNIITTQAYMTIDFNGSTLKVMYDSDNQSPYDTTDRSTSKDPYNFAGDAIHVATPYTHIVNLILIGDRIDRSWSNSNEKSMESTNGVKFSAGANFSSIKYSNISYFMGDAVALYYSPYTSFYVGSMEYGGLSSTGATITGATANTVRTISFVSIPAGITSFSMIGLGYAPQTNIPSHTYNVYFYDNNGSYIFAKTNVRTRDMVQIPRNATQLKLSWEGDGTLNGGSQNSTPFWSLLIDNGIADSVVVEFNEIHRNHRGGLFLGTNNAIIRKNYFHDTGQPDGMDIDGLPQFPSSTRYAIDTEDNVGQHCRILDNVFDNVRMAMCLRGEYNEVSGNEFRNCPYGIELYNLNHIFINNNYFYYSSIMCYPYDGVSRDWQITDNVFYASNFSLTGSGTITSAINNRFYSATTVNSSVRILSFKNNTFDGSSFSFIEYGTVLDSCSFINSSSVNITNTGRNIDNNIIRCNFNSSFIIMQSNPQVTVRDSLFNDAGFQYKSTTGIFVANNCIFNNPTKPVIGYTGNNPGLTTNILDLENCTLNLGAPNNVWKPSTSYAVGDIVIPATGNGYYYQCTTAGSTGTTQPTWPTTVGNTVTSGGVTFTTYQIVRVPVIYGFNWGKLIFNNSIININTYSNYTTALLDNYGNITDSIQIKNSTISSAPSTASTSGSSAAEIIIDGSTLTNFSITSPRVEVQSSKMNNEPNAGKFVTGQLVANATPQPGQYLGWVCLTGGRANNTAWSASHTYAKVDRIYSGTNVYETQTPGKSSTTAPTFPASLNITVDDIVGMNPWILNNPYNVGDKVLPPLGVSDPNTAPTLTLVANANTTLPTGNYYVKYTWVNSVGETTCSNTYESSITVTAGNNLSISVPAFPTGVTSAKIYVGTSSGQEIYQGSITTSGNSYVISTPINTTNSLVPNTSGNGYWYECTTAGTSGATAPTWTKTSGGTITSDGTNGLVWTIRQIVTWKNIDTKAVFKQYGLISS